GGVEVTVALAPVTPGAGQPVEHLPGILLAPRDRPAVAIERWVAVGADLRHAGLSEVLLGQDVGRDGRPPRRHLDALLAKDGRAVRVLDLRDPLVECDARVRVQAFLGETPGNLHAHPPCCVAVASGNPGVGGGQPGRTNISNFSGMASGFTSGETLTCSVAR